jgi:hypothetical protein
VSMRVVCLSSVLLLGHTSSKRTEIKFEYVEGAKEFENCRHVRRPMKRWNNFPNSIQNRNYSCPSVSVTILMNNKSYLTFHDVTNDNRVC